MNTTRKIAVAALVAAFAWLPLLAANAQAQDYPPQPPTTTRPAPVGPTSNASVLAELQANSAAAAGGANATAGTGTGAAGAGSGSGGAQLAFTGGEFSTELAASAIMIGVGGLFVVASRKQREANFDA
jgi:hypothetical protein